MQQVVLDIRSAMGRNLPMSLQRYILHVPALKRERVLTFDSVVCKRCCVHVAQLMYFWLNLTHRNVR